MTAPHVFLENGTYYFDVDSDVSAQIEDLHEELLGLSDEQIAEKVRELLAMLVVQYRATLN